MQRLLTDKLIEWRNDTHRKPLLIQGVRHSGKTYLLRDFGDRYYKDVFYFDFSTDSSVVNLLSQITDPQQIIKNLSIFLEKDISRNDALVIFDEIHLCPNILNFLRYFYESDEQYHIAAASSYLDIALYNGCSVPFDCIELLTLYPMNFYEFLTAQSPMLANHLRDSAFRADAYKTFQNQLVDKFNDYQIVGGMPAVVKDWIDNKSIENVDILQSQIIKSFENDFANLCPVTMLPKLTAVWNAIPSQLTKGNRKFMFSKVRRTWRGKDLDDAVYLLVRSGLAYKVEHIDKPEFPVSGFVDPSYFKLYMCDVGLLRRVGGFPASVILSRDSAYSDVRDVMAENIVCSELKHIYERDLYFWSAENPGKAEVDFIVYDGEDLVPIEVKSGSASRARSLLQYRMKFSPNKSVLTGADSDKDEILPLYAFWNLKEWLGRKK